MGPKTLVLLALGVTAFAMGALGQYAYSAEATAHSDVWLSLLAAFLGFFWYRLDSDELGYKRSVWLNVGIIAIGIVAFPYYFFRSRGAKRGGLASLLFLLALLAWGGLAMAGQYTVWYFAPD